jgi:hypothetical protein
MGTNLKQRDYFSASGQLTASRPRVIGRNIGVYSGRMGIPASSLATQIIRTRAEISYLLLQSYWEGSEMELHELRDHLDGRLDKLEDKLDNHLERISKAETSIEWIRGHLKISISIMLGALSFLTAALYNYVIRGN